MHKYEVKKKPLSSISLLIVILLLLSEAPFLSQNATASPSDEGAGVADSYAEEWSFSDMIPADAPRVGPGGNIYFYLSDGTFCSLSPEGRIQWTYDVNGTPYGYAFSSDGDIYVFSDALYDISPNGSLKWSIAIENPEKKAPEMLVSPSGTLYLVLYNVYAISSGGRLEWTYSASEGGPFYYGTLTSNNSLVAGSDTNDSVVAMDSGGNFLWDQKINRFAAGIFFSSMGAVLVTDDGGRTYAFSPAGIPLWNRSFEDFQISPGGQIYVFENGLPPRYRVLSPLNGEEMWNFSADYVVFSGNSTVLAYADDGLTLYSLDAGGRIQWEYHKSVDSLWFASSVVNSSGVIFFAVCQTNSPYYFIYSIIPGEMDAKLIATPSIRSPAVADPLIGTDAQGDFYLWNGGISAYGPDSDSDGIADSKDLLPNLDNALFYFILLILLVALLIAVRATQIRRKGRLKTRGTEGTGNEEHDHDT